MSPTPAFDPQVLDLARRWSREDPDPAHRAVLDAELAAAGGEGPAAEAADLIRLGRAAEALNRLRPLSRGGDFRSRAARR